MAKTSFINITPGICGVNSHQRILEGPEEGSIEIGTTTYFWHGGCPRCVEDKLKELRKEANGDNRN